MEKSSAPTADDAPPAGRGSRGARSTDGGHGSDGGNAQRGDFYRRLGGVLFARLALLLDDETAARGAADELFARYVTRRSGRADAAAPGREGAEASERRWVYRVATHAALQRLTDDAVPGGGDPKSSSRSLRPPARRPLPSMAELRRLDEVHANARVLCDFDGLTVDEVTEVLGTELPERLRRTLHALELAASGQPPQPAQHAQAAGHPSRFALDATPPSQAVVAHLTVCDDCSEHLARRDLRRREFADSIGPPEIEAMTATIAAATRVGRRRRKGVRQAVIVTAALLGVCALALVVARPRAPSRTDTPYAGVRGASRTKASGIQIYVRRDDGIHALDPQATVQKGDQLVFRVQVERPRFLELRARRRLAAAPAGGGAPVPEDVRVFPAAPTTTAALVTNGEYLAVELPVAVSAGGITVVGRFADHAFPLDAAAGPEIEVVPIRIDVASLR